MKRWFYLIFIMGFLLACKEGAEVEEGGDGDDNIINNNVALAIKTSLPSGILPYSTNSVLLQLETTKTATCKYADNNISFYGMQDEFSTTNGLTHTKEMSISAVGSYSYFVSCQDTSGAITVGTNKIEFTIDSNPVDVIAPDLYNAGPTTTQPDGTTQVIIYANTNEPSSCRYSDNIEHTWEQMNNMGTTGGNIHNQTITGLSDGNTYNFYFRCEDPSGNQSDQRGIAFSVSTFILQDGVTLYNTYCAFCHGDLPYSEKQGATVQRINNGINGVGSMRSLELLKPEEISNIADALQE